LLQKLTKNGCTNIISQL